MAKGKRAPAASTQSAAVLERLDRIENVVAANLLADGERGAPKVANSILGDAVGFGTGIGGAPGIQPGGFPGNQGNPWTPTISTSQTIFRNLRWYLVSNFRQMLSEAYVELGLVQVICQVPVEDALRGGVEISSAQLSPEEVEELQVSVDRDDDLGTMGEAGVWNRLFGGSGILILTDQDPIEPLDLESIDEDTPLEFRAADMWELTWDSQGADGWDPVSETEDAEYYSYYGERVHHSRVMKMVGIKAPSFIRPRLRGWGFSVVETLVRSINQYLKSNDLGFEVLDEFKVDVYKIKNLVNTLLSPQGKQKVQERIQLANWQKNYQNAIVMDSEDDWDHKQLSFAGLADAMKEIRMQVASDMRMPLTKLFGISATGFNSGEDDIEVYNSMVESSVRRPMKYHILRMLEVKCQKLFGFIPDDLKIAFKPLRVLSSEQEENVKTSKFTRALQARQAGEITSQEFRDVVNKDELLSIKLVPVPSILEEEQMGDDADDASEGPDDEEKTEDPANGMSDEADDDYEEPGADQEPSMKSKAKGSSKGLSKDPPSAKEARMPNARRRHRNDQKRDDDGKFGEGSGGSGVSDISAARVKAVLEKQKHRHNGEKYHSHGDKEAATAKARKLRADGVHASIAHVGGPKSGKKAVYAVMVPEKHHEVKNRISARAVVANGVKPWSSKLRLLRTLNSGQFDKASYMADGGDAWIDPRRKLLFDDPMGVDEALWERAKAASRDALGEVRWQFCAWWYRKQGGQFNAV